MGGWVGSRQADSWENRSSFGLVEICGNVSDVCSKCSRLRRSAMWFSLLVTGRHVAAAAAGCPGGSKE